MATLNLGKTKKNLLATIARYRNLKTMQANDDERDRAVTEAVTSATSWLQAGVVGSQLSSRFSLLQKPIGSISADIEALRMRFDEGTVGSYTSRGTTADGTLAFVLSITRIPTTGMCSATNTYFSVSGYVLDGGKVKHFSPPGIPVFCTGAFFSTSVPEKVSLVMNLSAETSNAGTAGMHIKSASIVISGDRGGVKTSIGFNDGKLYVFDLHSQHGVALQERDGCVACEAGAGTNCASYTHSSGTGVVFTENIGPNGRQGGSPSAPANVGPDGKQIPLPAVQMTGWFDHQWANETPHTFIGSTFRTLEDVVQTPRSYSYIWIGLQVSSTLQYVALLKTARPSRGQRMQRGSEYSVTVSRYSSGVATYNLPKCTVTIKAMMPEDAYLPAEILINIPGDGSYVVRPSCDGRVTSHDGSIDLQGVLHVYDESRQKRRGVGYIFGTGLHMQINDVTHMMHLGNLRGSPVPFLPHKIEGKDAAAPIALIVGLSALGILILAGIITALVYAFRKK